MPVSTAKRDTEKDAIKLENIRSALKCIRVNHRRTVVWPATLYVGEFEFRAMLYDISLGGVRLKLPLPLANGTEASVKIKNQVTLNSSVVWCAGEFIGLKFSDPIEAVRKALGDLSTGLQ
ncbi:hypothetical protein MNBD_ALPHA02-2254 [hydrothermal vent metagenome]|uniref:PilZ domain-containing protein n=1 Tax=hydrothermal vent metagenome TaxID=652676 RepID=A0A3B0RVA9_9ZZZZ